MARKLLRLCGRFTPARKHALPASLHHRRLRYELLESRVLLSSGVTNLSFRTGDQLNSQILDDIHAGNLVYLRADASGMEGQKITVELWEDNGVGDYKVLTTPITINAEGFGTAAWLATWQATDMAPFNRYYLFYDVPWSTSNLYSGDPNTGHFQVSASVDNKIEGAAYDLNNPIQTTPVVLKRFGSDSIDPNLDTWVVIHGRTSSAAESYIFDLAKTLSDRVEQVLTLDWKRGADTRDFSGERWIVPVAKWASDVLHDYGLSGSRLNLVGHSWGAVVASELSAAFPGGVQRLVALDPAEDAWPPLGAAYDTGTANFNAHSGYSWAFYSQGPYWNSVSWNPGNERTPTTADEAIVVMQTTHDGVVRLFSYMLGQPEQAISGVFSLDRLVKGRGGPWSENRYNDDGDPGAGPNYGYEAVITAETVGISPRPVRLNYIDNKNKPAVLFEKTADTTPPVVALYGLSSAESSPTKLGGSQSLSVTARAVDPESKIEAGESYRFYAQTKSLAGWGNRWFLGSSSGTDKKDLGRMPEGLHRVWVEVKNGTGLSGQSPYGFVYVPTSTPPPSADPSPFSAAARDDHSNLFGPSDTTITASAQVPGQIERAEDHDWFRYTATRNGSIVVDVMPLDNRLQPHLRFHWDNKILIRQDIGGGAGTAAKVSYAGAEAGRTYYIDVSGVGGTVGGYTVRVTQPSQVPPDPAEYRPSPSEAADDYPNTKSSAIPVALDDEGRTTISGRIQPVGDEDWTTFTARRTGLLLIEADTPNSSLDTLLRLFNSGVLVAQDHSRIERRVNAGETYWLDVRAGSENGPGDIKPGEDPTGKYVIRITQPRDEDQSGSSGTDTTPGPLPGWGGVRGVQINLSNGNGSSRGAIDDPAETDWFQINGAHDGNMQILVVANNSEVVPFVTAFRSNGGGIDSDTAEFDREAKVGFHIAQNEVICVAVKSHGGRSTGGYTITVTQPSSLPNDDLPDFGETPRELRVPNDITTGGSGFLYARIETPDDNDWIRIPVLGSGYLHVQVTTNDGGLVPMLELNRDGSSGGWFDSDDGRDGLANIAFLPSGVSYVWAKVSGLDGTQGAYAITTWRSQNLDLKQA